MLTEALFNGWEPLAKTLIVTLLAYPLLLLMLRLSGHRTLAKLNAFDLVITVALGSTLASIVLSSDVSLAQGCLAFVLLAGLQYLVARATMASPSIESLINGEPVLLWCRGNYLKRTMNRARITEDELKAAVRATGHAGFDGLEAVILETNGNLSVVSTNDGATEALEPVYRARGFNPNLL